MHPTQSITLLPTAAIVQAGPVINVTAGGSLALNASSSSCPGTPGNCTRTWNLSCGGRTPVLAGIGNALLLTTGAAANRTVNTTRGIRISCVATLTVTDGYGLTATANASVQV